MGTCHNGGLTDLMESPWIERNWAQRVRGGIWLLFSGTKYSRQLLLYLDVKEVYSRRWYDALVYRRHHNASGVKAAHGMGFRQRFCVLAFMASAV